MKKIELNKIKFNVVFLLLFSIVVDRAIADEIPAIIFEKSYGKDTNFHNINIVNYLEKTGETIVAGTKTSPGAKGENPNYFLWLIDQEGEVKSEFDLSFLPIDGKFGSLKKYLRDLHIDPFGNRYLLYTSQNRISYLAKFDGQQKISFIKNIELKDDLGFNNLELFKIVANNNNELLLLGRSNDDAIIVKTNENGEVIWGKLFDRERFELFLDGFYRADGNYVIYGNSAKYEVSSFYPSQSNIWLSVINDDGEIIQEIMHPGRYGKITKGNKYKIFVVYDKNQSADQQISILKVNRDLEIEFDLEVFESKAKFYSESFIFYDQAIWVASESLKDIFVGVYDLDGKLLGNYIGSGQLNSKNIKGAALINGELIMGTRVHHANTQRQLNDKVGIIKFGKK